MQDNILFPNETIITTDYFTVGQDWEIPIPGFFVVAALRNIQSIDECTDEEAQEFINLVRKIRTGMREVLQIQDVYFFQNEDTEHGFHVWIFPRHEWMDEFGRKIESVRPIMNYAKEHMMHDDVFKQVREDVKKMKEYMCDWRG